uniref:Acyl carrier protein n=1 Tax=Pristionchus pacificus TaxID=54126 RepID=A1BQ80_PRIPA|nr:unknown [Pristionchus pacificus]
MLGTAVCRVASRCCQIAARNLSVRPTTVLPRLTTASSFKVQTRLSSVEVFGPFDPPKQLTFKEVEERVLKAIRSWDRFPADKATLLKLEAIFSEMGFDSLDHVEIMMAIEDEFAFEIPLTDAEKLKTPKDIFKFICEREDVFE